MKDILIIVTIILLLMAVVATWYSVLAITFLVVSFFSVRTFLKFRKELNELR